MTEIGRRKFITTAGASLLAAGFPSISRGATPHVVVVGGGAAGTIAARQIGRSGADVRVTLIERNDRYHSTLLGSQVSSGLVGEVDTDFGYEGLATQAISVIHDVVSAIDLQQRQISLGSGDALSYDRLILAPGIQVDTSSIAGYDANSMQLMPHAWRDADQSLLLWQQIESMRPGGTMIVAIPADPVSSPAAPYERASHIAYFLKQKNPTAKLLICDAKNDFPQAELFKAAWDELHSGMIEWIGEADTGGEVVEVDSSMMKISFPKQSLTADVINVIPRQAAGALADSAEVRDTNGWCPVDISTFESRAQAGVYVIGDATDAHVLPKTAQMANSQAKICASAVVASLTGAARGPVRFIDVDYSVVAPDYAFYSATTYRPDDSGEGVTIVSTQHSTPESARSRDFYYAMSWYSNLNAEMFS